MIRHLTSRRPGSGALLNRAGQILCAGGLGLLLSWGLGAGRPVRAADSAAPAPIGLTVTADAAKYQPGKPVTLTVTVVNRSAAPCELSDLADGTLTLDATRDGTPLTPAMGRIDYADGYESELASSSVLVPPGGSRSFTLRSAPASGRASADAGQFLRTVAVVPHDNGVTADWPVGPAGAYALSMTYRMPAGANACRGGSDPVAVAFDVSPKDCAVPAGILTLLAGGRRRRRGRGRRGPLRTAAAVSAVSAALLGVAAPAAYAKVVWDVEMDTRSVDFGEDCVKKFSDLDVPDGFKAFVAGPRNVFVKTGPKNEENIVNGSLEITWNRYQNGFLDDKTPFDACAILYHELVHAFDDDAGITDKNWCDSVNIRKNEIRATLAENKYRATQHKDPRHSYDGYPLPAIDDPGISAIDDECSKAGPPRPPGKHAHHPSSGGAGSDGSGSNGDPHLTTFDNRRYDLQAVGEFVLARSGTDLEVQTRQAAFPNSGEVTVNSAVGMRVGPDRLTFTMADSEPAVRVNGQALVLPAAPDTPAPLPGGGGTVQADETGTYAVTWPDGTEADVTAIGVWGFRVLMFPAATRHGRFQGLLGHYDLDPANDLTGSTGVPLPADPTRQQLYGDFADGWRVTDATSLLPYPPGTNTATFTDKSFPRKLVTVADLDPAARSRAQAVCAALGITDPEPLDACVIDVALTGRPEFAASAAATDQNIGSQARGGPVPPPPAAPLRDGDVQSGTIGRPGQVDVYPLSVTEPTVLHLEDVTGGSADPDGAQVRIGIVPGSDPSAPGVTYNNGDVHQYRLAAGGKYSVQVTRDTAGPYTFRVVAAKEKRLTTTLDHLVSGNLETPGRVDVYSFTAPKDGKVYVNNGTGCGNGLGVGFADDTGPVSDVLVPADPCTTADVGYLYQGKPYLMVVWSNDQKTGSYSFTPSQTPAVP